MVYPRLNLGFEYRNRRYRDAEKGLRAFAGDIGKSLDSAGPVLSQEMRTFLEGVAEALARRHSGAWPGGTSAAGTSPGTLSRRAGGMIASIRASVQVIESQEIERVEGQIGGSFVAGVQERGATITPKRAQYLTVPLPGALDSRGVPLRARARDWDNTFVTRSRAGNLIIFRRVGTEVTPLYALKRRVTVPPRLGMRATIDAGIPLFVDRAVDRLLKHVLAGAA